MVECPQDAKRDVLWGRRVTGSSRERPVAVQANRIASIMHRPDGWLFVEMS
jgi:hypothetical protein